MATIYLRAESTNDYFLASTSSQIPTSASDTTSYQMWVSGPGGSAKVSLAVDPATGLSIQDSLMLKIRWNGGDPSSEQEAILVSSGARGAKWKYNNHVIGVNEQILVNSGDTIYCEHIDGDGTTPTETPTNLTVAGYWVSGVGTTDGVSDSTVGSWNNPSKWHPREKQRNISWTAPATTENPVAYLVISWKDWSGKIGQVGDVHMTSGNTTSYEDTTTWAASLAGSRLKYSVFAVYKNGVSPDIATIRNKCYNGGGERQQSTIDTFSQYMLFATSGLKTTYQVTFYNEDGVTVLDNGSGVKFQSWYVEGGKVVAPSGSVWVPEGKEVLGWYQKINGSWSTQRKSSAEVNQITVSSNLEFKVEFGDLVRTITFDPGEGTVDPDTKLVTVGQPIGELPIPIREGYDFDGWYYDDDTKAYDSDLMPNEDIILVAHWKEALDTVFNDLVFLHYEKPQVGIGVKRDSLENPEGVKLWVKPTLYPIIDANGKDKNFVSSVSDIKYRDEIRGSSSWTSGGTSAYDTRVYYNWQTAASEDDIIRNLDGECPGFETDVLFKQNGDQIDFSIDQEYQLHCKLKDALQSYASSSAEKYSGISAWSNIGLLLKYVTKLLVHNPFMDEVLKETRGTKKLRPLENPPETDFWQIRQHTQNQANNIQELEEAVYSLLRLRGDEQSVEGFTDLQNYIIPTLMRQLEEDENLVYDKSQINALVDILYKINSSHEKISREHSEYEESSAYKGLVVGDLETASDIDSKSVSSRVLELDGERHQGTTNWIPVENYDGNNNAVRDTAYKKVELANFDGEQLELEAQSTVDHINDYDISQLDLKNSLSDLIYILSRMRPRAEGSEFGNTSAQQQLKVKLNNPDLDPIKISDEEYDTTEHDRLMAAYWDSDNNKFKTNTFTNWKDGVWQNLENTFDEYDSSVDGTNVIVGQESLDTQDQYDDDFANNGCKAACMGLCTSGCYQSCVGGCSTACGTSCFFGCMTSCTTGCGSGCANSCTGSCTGSCKDGCQGCTASCKRECQGSCGSGCSSGCEAACKRSCHSGCSDACTGGCSGHCTNTCTTYCAQQCIGSCFSSCNTGCAFACKAICTDQCSETCGVQCSSGCSGTCNKNCEGQCKNSCMSTCSGACGTSCGNNCNLECADGCGSDCYSQCASNCAAECTDGCGTSCATSCSSECTYGCRGECINSCEGDCLESCSGVCSELCIGSCSKVCGGSCTTECGYSCSSSCGGDCENNCGGLCYTACGGSCGTTCGGTCKTSCYNQCTTRCAHDCASTCSYNCTLLCATCSVVCSYDCDITCIDGCRGVCQENCANDCSSSCTQWCFSTCTGTCVTSCSKQCSDTCSSECNGSCTRLCAYNCSGGCTTNCSRNCSSQCSGSCAGTCSDSCLGDCENGCGNGCSATCGGECATTCEKSCANDCKVDCTGSCSATCGTFCTFGCTITCDSDCKLKCTATCREQCSWGCGENCTTTCGTSCSSSCGTGCNNDCKGSCKSTCKTACTSNCSDACSVTCTTSCGADCTGVCSYSCGSDCTADCASSCGDSCGRTCGGSCSASCSDSCQTECVHFCTGTAKSIA